MEEKILLAKYGSDKTPLKLGNLELECYVLETKFLFQIVDPS